jgi:uncharacterized phage-associated protein
MTMPDPTPSLGPTERAYLTVLREARQRGFTMTRMKVAKLLYLADLELTRERGHQASEARWKWDKFGPFDRDLLRVEDVLHSTSMVDVEKTHNFFGSKEIRVEIRAEGEAEILDGWAARVIAEVVAKFGDLTPSSLKDLTYSTEPMLLAQEAGIRDVDLDLDIVQAPPSEEAHRALADLREAASALPVEESSEGAMQALEEDIEAFADLRAEANRELLG